MQEQSLSPEQLKAKLRIDQLRRQILDIDYVCSGTVVTSTTTCGKPSCRCATDPAARHGPYYQWNRMIAGKLVHTTVSPEIAAQIKAAIANYRGILRLLKVWEDETRKILGIKKQRK